MKPHIKKVGRYWYCAGEYGARRHIGMGWTPKDAYSSWLVLGVTA